MLKFQNEHLDQAIIPQLLSYWLDKLPITHDVEEAQLQYEFLSDCIMGRLDMLIGGNAEAAASQLAKIMGEAFDEKYFDEKKPEQVQIKLKVANAVRFMMGSAGDFSETFKQTCATILSAEQQKNVESAFNYQVTA